MRKNNRILCALLVVALVLSLAGCTKKEETAQSVRLSSWSDFVGKTFSAVDGTVFDALMEDANLIPGEISWDFYPTSTDAVLAVVKKRADACTVDKPVAELMVNTYPELGIYKDYICEDNYGFVLQKGSDLTEKVNAIIETCHADGTTDRLRAKWFTEDVEDLSVPEVTWSCENGTLKVGMVNSLMPMAYLKENKPMGYEAEMIYIIAEQLHMEPEVTPCDFSALLAGVSSGKFDIAAGTVSITEERRESVDLTVPEYYGAAVVLCRKEDIEEATETQKTESAASGKARFSSWDDFDGITVSDIDSSTLSKLVEQSGLISGELNYVYLPTSTDAAMAVVNKKADVFVTDLPMAEMIANTYPELGIYKDVIGEDSYGFILQKDSPITEQANAVIEKCREDGTLDALHDKWFAADTKGCSMPEIDWSGENGTLRLALNTSMPPMEYISDGEPMGYEAELAYIIARELNLKLEVTMCDFASMLSGVSAGKFDMAGGSLSITEERKQKLDMTVPDYYGATVFLCRKEDIEAETAAQNEGTVLESWDDFVGLRIAVMDSTALIEMVEDSGLIPGEVNWINFPSISDSVIGVLQNKADACVVDEPVAQLVTQTYPELAIYKDVICDDSYGYLLPKGSELTEKFNKVITQFREDGTLEKVRQKWFTTELDGLSVPEQGWSGENGTLRVATDPTSMPMEYMIDDQIVGYEVEVVYEIAKMLDMKVELITCDFGSILGGISSGKYDLGIGCISITEERQETMDMTVPIYDGATVFVYKPGKTETSTGEGSLDAYENATLAAWQGSIYDAALKVRFPNAEVVYNNSLSEMAECIRVGKIEAFCASDAIVGPIVRANNDLQILPDAIDTFEAGYALKKGSDSILLEQLNEYIAEARENGELEKLKDIWMSGKTEEINMEFSGENGDLVFAADFINEPFTFIKDEEMTGYDVDLIARFCKEYGYNLVLENASFYNLIPGLDAGRYDVVGGSMEISDEHKEAVDMTDANYTGDVVLVIGKEVEQKTGFFTSVTESFEKTFLRENRWKMFLSGIGTTLLITILSMIFGSILGFALYLLCKGGNVIANKVTGFCIWLVEGMPMVVLLMILFYVVFGSVAISGLWVSVIGFTMTFGASMYGMVKAGVDAVDPGQMEAALAMGYGKNAAFFRMVLPQAARHFLPAYKSATVQHIKATSIVGYIAVQDLTKMSDIIRSRTYEAFFPLIATAIIYFVLSGLLTSVIKRLQFNLDSRSRDNRRTLKGVKLK